MSEPEMKVYYVCDPDKNTVCRKTNCHLNGGPCIHTTKLDYAKQPVERVKLVIPMDKTDAVNLGVMSAEEDQDVRE